MNILMISDVYMPRINGVSTSIAVTRKTLHKLGHHSTLLVPAYPGYVEDAPDIHRVEARQLPFDPEDFLMKWPSLLRTANALNSRSFDIIHVHTPFMAHRLGVLLKKSWGIPVIETYHTHFEEYIHHYIPFLPKALGKLFARRIACHLARGISGFVVPSSAISTLLSQYGIKLPLHRVPTGLDLEEFQPGNALTFCEQYKIDIERPSMVYIGRVAFEKNIGLLLDVVQHVRESLPDILLIIAGEGPARIPLEKKCHELGLDNNVLFVGYLQRGQPLWDCFAAGDLFVFASHTETQGLVLLEAMALGIPVVSYASLGASDVLKNDAGAVIIKGDARAFADTILKLLAQPELLITMQKQGMDYVKSWTCEEMVGRLVGVYQQHTMPSSSSLEVPITIGS